jgi:hypothetical protein
MNKFLTNRVAMVSNCFPNSINTEFGGVHFRCSTKYMDLRTVLWVLWYRLSKIDIANYDTDQTKVCLLNNWTYIPD